MHYLHLIFERKRTMELSAQNGIKLKNYSFDFAVVTFMVVVCLVMLYPFLYCLAYSLSNSTAVMTKPVTVFPIGFTLENYAVVFKNKLIFNSLLISAGRTVLGILYSVTITALASFAISKRNMPGNRAISIFLIIPMYVSGGLLPYYVLIHDLHLFNNFLVYIIPHGFWAFYMLIMRSYFDTLPPSLEESAKLDGAGDLRIFVNIVFPLSMPIIATVAMYVGVWQWNSWFDATLFTTKVNLLPMQSILQRLLLENFSSDLQAQARLAMGKKDTSPESLRMATVMVSTLPIICIYPFFQRYFIKGIMIGSVKA